MLAEWLAQRALDKRLETHIARTYQEVTDALENGERDPDELQTTLAARYQQLADAVGDRVALVLSTYVFIGALEAIHHTIAAGEAADTAAQRIAPYCCEVSGLDNTNFRRLFTQIETGDREVGQGLADDPLHVLLAAFAIEHQLREGAEHRFTIRHFIDTYNASEGPVYPPAHITNPPAPVEALRYLAAALLVGLCTAWLTVANDPKLVVVPALAAIWLLVRAIVTYRRSRSR